MNICINSINLSKKFWSMIKRKQRKISSERRPNFRFNEFCSTDSFLIDQHLSLSGEKTKTSEKRQWMNLILLDFLFEFFSIKKSLSCICWLRLILYGASWAKHLSFDNRSSSRKRKSMKQKKKKFLLHFCSFGDDCWEIFNKFQVFLRDVQKEEKKKKSFFFH